ncbi:hypothetical protein EB001_24430 [bacterium]|nr:hypothetical protein [bacterium]
MIFGEYSKSHFSKAYLIEAYIANVEGFEGDGDFFSKFGLEIRDSSNFIISRRSFVKMLPSTMRTRPQEGDLVYVPLMNRVFEIKFIEKKLLFYSLGNREPYIYEMRCEMFRFSEEPFDTGVTQIDEIGADNSYTIKINLGNRNYSIDDFIDGETVYQSPDGTWANVSAHATLKEWYKANGDMYIYNINGSFANNANVHGNTSHADYMMLAQSNHKEDYVSFDIFDNRNLDTGADLMLDLSEVNPFGTP